MPEILVIGLGGFLGAIARYGIASLVHHVYRGPFPLGTLTVNVLGCFIIGVLMALLLDRPLIGPQMRLFLTIGLLGSLTTFSTFGNETYDLLAKGHLGLALGNVATSVLLGLGAVGLGHIVVRALA